MRPADAGAHQMAPLRILRRLPSLSVLRRGADAFAPEQLSQKALDLERRAQALAAVEGAYRKQADALLQLLTRSRALQLRSFGKGTR
jgi:hypothetical protein